MIRNMSGGYQLVSKSRQTGFLLSEVCALKFWNILISLLFRSNESSCAAKNGAKNRFDIFAVCHLPISDRRPRNCRSFAERNPVGENQRAELQEALQVPVPRQDRVQQREKPVSGTASHLLFFV